MGSPLGILQQFTRVGSSWLLNLSRFQTYLFPIDGAEIVRRQVEETRTALPTLALFQFCATLAMGKILVAAVPPAMLLAWVLANMCLTVVLGSLYFNLEHVGVNFAKARRILKLAPLLTATLGILWACEPLVFAHYLSLQTNLVVYPFVMVVVSVVLLCAVRLPTSAMLFAALVLGAIVISMARLVDGAPFEFAIFGLLLVGTTCGVVLALHRNFIQQCGFDENRTRDAEVIKLLLNEFETGVGDWLWETDKDGKLVYASARLSQILNIPLEILRGQSLSSILHLPAECNFDEALLLGQPILNFETRSEFDGKVWHWEISAKALFDGQEFMGFRGVGRDVTLHKLQTLQIQHAREEAERANTAKSQFLAVISHELRTPINAIVGFSEVLSAGQGESLPMAARREYLGTILESAKHLQGLINDVLDATRMERGAIHLDEQFNDAAELIEVVVKILRDQAIGSNVSLIAHVMEDVQVMSDLTRLKQVIINLITNAIKFSPAGGIVNIDMTRASNGDLIVSVRDAGIGISKEDAERVFEPFVQVENGMTRRFGGIGLGLAIARKIARIHGGDLTLNGELGVGTDARLLLPASRISWSKAKKQGSAQVVAA